MSRQPNPCERLIPYLLQELPPEEADVFAAHLEECEACGKEFAELRETWEMLPFAAEEVDMPEDRKEQVFAAILNGPNQADATQADAEEMGIKKGLVSMPNEKVRPSKRRTFGYAAAAVVCLAAGAIAAWGWTASRGSETTIADEKLQPPAQVVKQLSLKAFDKSMPEANGTGWLTRQGNSERLTLQMNGLALTSGEEAYQVWLIKDGKRHNGGTFRVDEQGRGVLTLELRPDETAFEAVGITLEPDAGGTQPRGKKVLGT